MAKNLLIVESPAKAKTINKYLGKDFQVLASYGHVRDLVPKEGAVDPDNDFAMNYDLIEKNDKHVDAIVKAHRKADALYLATDLDREGEAISWHIAEILREKQLLKDKRCIAWCSPRSRRARSRKPSPIRASLSMDLVNAQQARRALDYLVGFNLSPVLWRKVQRGLSAGRVQSPALRMIVEREEEIEAFIAREYWTIEADLAHPDQAVQGASAQAQRQEVRAVRSDQRGRCRTRRVTRLHKAAQGRLVVGDVQSQGTQAPAVAAVHDLDPAAGSRAQARLRDQPHHARSRSNSMKASRSATKAWSA